MQLSLAFVVGLASITASQPVNINLQVKVPQNASDIVDRSFVGFGIECLSFPDYTGNQSSPNIFSQNMISTFSNRTGAPVYIRVGGNSQDNSQYDPNQNQAIKHTDDTTNFYGNITLGKIWPDSFKMLPHTKWILDIPLARKNLSNAIMFAKASIDAIGIENLDSIEIGNEPDLYTVTGNGNSHSRPLNYDPTDYVREFGNFSAAILKNTQLGDGPHFQALTYASGAKAPWNIENAWNAGIAKPGLVKSVSQHYYQSVAGQSLQNTLMNHEFTASHTNVFKDPINFLKSKNIPFVLGEVGSALGGQGVPTGYDELSASLGSALWTVDWMLYAITLGVKRVSMQMGTNIPFSAWQPIDTTTRPAQVNGNFYGNVFVADFIGTAGSMRVSPLDTGDLNITAYGGYQSGTLSKVALVNLQLWKAGSASPRPSKNITLAGLTGVKNVRIERLTGPSGDAQQNISWAGYQWTAKKNGIPEILRNDTTERSVVDGAVNDIHIQASEALLVSLAS